MDAPALIASLHGQALRMMCTKLNAHYTGLASAARAARRQNLLSNNLQKKLYQLDIAFAFCRHVSEPLVPEFLRALDQGTSALSEVVFPDYADYVQEPAAEHAHPSPKPDVWHTIEIVDASEDSSEDNPEDQLETVDLSAAEIDSMPTVQQQQPLQQQQPGPLPLQEALRLLESYFKDKNSAPCDATEEAPEPAVQQQLQQQQPPPPPTQPQSKPKRTKGSSKNRYKPLALETLPTCYDCGAPGSFELHYYEHVGDTAFPRKVCPQCYTARRPLV